MAAHPGRRCRASHGGSVRSRSAASGGRHLSETLQGLIARTLHPARGRAWHGGPTPYDALRGVSAAQARRRPARGRHSIWELALHIAYWDYAVRRRLSGGRGPRFPRSPANWPTLPRPADEAAWAADRELLLAAQRDLIAVVERFPTARLDRRVARGKRWSFRDLILGILVHDAYHAGQIQLLKRLVRSV